MAAVPPSGGRVVSETLMPGDVVRLSFTGARQHDVTQKIRPNGTISLPLIGEYSASGQSVTALQSDLARRYKPQLQDSEVVAVLDTSAAAVYVTGAVN
jgi:polysaccharide biosynthesis/export protein